MADGVNLFAPQASSQSAAPSSGTNLFASSGSAQPAAQAPAAPLTQADLFSNPAQDSSVAPSSAPLYSNGGQLDAAFPQSIQQAKDISSDPLNLKANPMNALRDSWDAITGSVSQAGNDIANVFSQNSDTPGAAGRAGSALKAVVSTANAAFSPISSLFSAANDIPVLGSFSKLLGLGFTSVGESAGGLAKSAVDAMPIPDDVKSKIRDGVGDIASLAAQIAIGGAAHDVLTRAEGPLTEKYGEEDAKTIMAKAQELADQKKASSEFSAPKEELAAIADRVRATGSQEAPVPGQEEPITEKPPAVPAKGGAPEIVTDPSFRTFDFNELEGKPQTDEQNGKIHDQIVNHPDEPMTPSGESFNAAAERALPKIREILASGENVALTTHNSMYGLIKLWDEYGRPDTLTKRFREDYTQQDNSNPTGDHYDIKGKDGEGSIELIRHGETSDNAKKVFRTSEATLTDKGREQAGAAGDDIADKGITKIYSSDLPRAVETSNIIRDKIAGTENEEAAKPKVSTAPERDAAAKKPVDTGGNEKVGSKSVTIDSMKDHLSPDEFEKFQNETAHEKSVRVDQVTKARDFVNNNPEDADKVIFGSENPPKGILAQDVFGEARAKALEEYKAGKIPFEDYYKYVVAHEEFGSRSGQELQARKDYADRDDPASWLTKAREAAGSGDKTEFRARAEKAARVARDAVSKAKAKLLDYDKIIDSITC